MHTYAYTQKIHTCILTYARTCIHTSCQRAIAETYGGTIDEEFLGSTEIRSAEEVMLPRMSYNLVCRNCQDYCRSLAMERKPLPALLAVDPGGCKNLVQGLTCSQIQGHGKDFERNCLEKVRTVSNLAASFEAVP